MGRWRLGDSVACPVRALGLLLLAACCACVAGATLEADRAVLLRFLGTVRRPERLTQGTSKPWSNATAPCEDRGHPHPYSNWEGVSCEVLGSGLRVTGLALSQKGSDFGGELPPFLSELDQLKSLYFDDSGFIGALPESWASWASLESLILKDNMLGTLPAAWGGCKTLRQLWLTKNAIHGSLPPSWAGMDSLESLSLDQNQLEGELPANWAGLPNLTLLSLSGQSGRNGAPKAPQPITGLIPALWCQKTAFPKLESLLLSALSLDKQPLPGVWPASLRELDVSFNQFTSLPRKLPRRLATFLANDNPFLCGGLFAGISLRLGTLDLSNANLSGLLPANWASPNLYNLLLSNNTHLSGSLPATWAKNLPSLSLLYLDGLGVEGPLPKAWGAKGAWASLLRMTLFNNPGLTEPIPKPWGWPNRLGNLNFLRLKPNTGLCGPVRGGLRGKVFGDDPPTTPLRTLGPCKDA